MTKRDQVDHQRFEAIMRQIDRELGSEQVPVRDRPFKAVLTLCERTGRIPMFAGADPSLGPLDGANLPRTVQRFYDDEYDSARLVVPPLGVVPVRIRGAIFALKIPVAYGTGAIEALDFVDGLTRQMRINLSPDELAEVRRAAEEGYSVIYEVEDFGSALRMSGRYNNVAVDYFTSALRDRDSIAPTFVAENYNYAAFHSQQYAEKMLKGAMLAENPQWNPPNNHEVKGVFRSLLAMHQELQSLAADIDVLRGLSMKDLRYKGTDVTQGAAYEAAWSSLRVGANVARSLSGMPARRVN